MHFGYLSLCVILAVAFACVSAYDPALLQDFCVATNEANNGVYVNGAFCKNPNLTTSDDFHFNGVLTPANTSNYLGSKVTHFFVDQVPGLNTLGVGLARIDYELKGLNPPHIHSRASEILTCLEGTLYVGFVASNTGSRFFTKTLHPGDAFIFPIGTIHFQYNIGRTKAVALASFGGQSPAVYTVANAIFNSNPAIEPEVLAKAFQLELEEVEKLLSKTWFYN